METGSKNKKSSRSSLGIPLGMMVALFCYSGQAAITVQSTEFLPSDKLIHFLVFGLLATGWLQYLKRVHFSDFKASLAAIFITACFGLVDELHQGMTPGRYMDFYDWLMDASGACVAVFVYRHWPSYRKLLEFSPLRWLSKQKSALGKGRFEKTNIAS